VQRDAGHRDPITTKLFDRRGHNPEKAASLVAAYWFSIVMPLRGNF